MNSGLCKTWPKLNCTFHPVGIGRFCYCEVHWPLFPNNMAFPLHICREFIFRACLAQPGWGVLGVGERWMLWRWDGACPVAGVTGGGRSSGGKALILPVLGVLCLEFGPDSHACGCWWDVVCWYSMVLAHEQQVTDFVMGALSLNSGPMNLEAGSHRGVWIRLALKDLPSLC